MRSVLASLLLPFILVFPGHAVAQNLSIPTPPSFTIVFKNNDPTLRVYPVISVGVYNPAQTADLWMQAEFGDEKNAAILPPIVKPDDATTRRFGTSHVYRAYINSTVGNPPGGVGPGHTVTITVPFYTQLQDVTKANLGINSDEFIDWWNAVRIYFFYGPVALNSALITGSPVPVNFSNTTSPTQTKPTCSIDDGTSCVVDFITHTIDPLANIPFQLQEYTFASASGPKPGGVLPAGSPFKIDRTYVNYNVSSLDSVYLPLAIGPYNFNDPVGDSRYLGDGATTASFIGTNYNFANGGSGWPFFVPTYFNASESASRWPPLQGQPCSLNAPFTDAAPPIPAYAFPKIPGTANLLIESYRFVPGTTPPGTLVPPLLSSQPPNFGTFPGFNMNQCLSMGIAPFNPTPALGTNGQAVVDLWNKCTQNQSDTTATCKSIRLEQEFFLNNFKQKCGWSGKTPDTPSTLFAVYGWVPISFPLYPAAGETPCQGGALVDTAGTPNYKTAITQYCDLQYNYLTLPSDPTSQTYVFNPYTRLIHETQGSSAYAFSIDDASAFRHVIAGGIIITLGGTSGLQNTTPSPLPTAGTIFNFCRTTP
jgi:hypothetical protein